VGNVAPAPSPIAMHCKKGPRKRGRSGRRMAHRGRDKRCISPAHLHRQTIKPTGHGLDECGPIFKEIQHEQGTATTLVQQMYHIQYVFELALQKLVIVC
jgi:hypothetical protein